MKLLTPMKKIHVYTSEYTSSEVADVYPWFDGSSSVMRVDVSYRPILYVIVAWMDEGAIVLRGGACSPKGWYYFKAVIKQWEVFADGKARPLGPAFYDNLGEGPFDSSEAARSAAIMSGWIPFMCLPKEFVPPPFTVVIEDVP